MLQWGFEPRSVRHMAFQPDALPTSEEAGEMTRQG